MKIISFFVPGDPKGQPRPRAFAFHGTARVYDPGTAEGWKNQIAIAAKPLIPISPISIPVTLEISFFIRRPKSHFKKTGLREGAPKACCKKPDIDNYAKAVMDALTTLGFWTDDSLVWELKCQKIYSDKPGAQIHLITETSSPSTAFTYVT